MAPEALEFGFQFADAFLELGQAVEGCDGFEPLAIVNCGIAGIHGVRRDVVGDAAFGRDDAAVANREMAGSAHLPGENAAVADLCRTSEADLAAEHSVDADARCVADDDQVVKLGAATYASFADGGAVHAGVGLDFDFVFQNCRAGLLHFVPRAVALFSEAETVAADDDAILEDDAIADLAEFADNGVGVGEEIITDAGTLINRDVAVENSVAANVGVFFDDAVGADMGASADFRRFGDERCRMKAGFVARGLIEEFDGVREGEIGVGGAQSGELGHAGVALDMYAVLNQDGGGAGGLEKREVAAISEKRDLAGLGVLDAGDPMDGGFARAVEAAAEFLGDIGEFRGHKEISLRLSASLAQPEQRCTAEVRYSLKSRG